RRRPEHVRLRALGRRRAHHRRRRRRERGAGRMGLVLHEHARPQRREHREGRAAEERACATGDGRPLGRARRAPLLLGRARRLRASRARPAAHASPTPLRAARALLARVRRDPRERVVGARVVPPLPPRGDAERRAPRAPGVRRRAGGRDRADRPGRRAGVSPRARGGDTRAAGLVRRAARRPPAGARALDARDGTAALRLRLRARSRCVRAGAPAVRARCVPAEGPAPHRADGIYDDGRAGRRRDRRPGGLRSMRHVLASCGWPERALPPRAWRWADTMGRAITLAHDTGDDEPVGAASNEHRTVYAVLAGALYNGRQLRTALAGQHALAGRDDAEVVVHLYEERGVQCVKALRGAFAFVLWDERRQRLLIARDQLGLVPLYYAADGHRLVVSSMLPAVTAFPGAAGTWDAAALDAFLTLGAVPPPATFHTGISQLGPGELAVWEDGRVRTQRYWQLTFPERRMTRPDVPAVIREQMLEAHRLRQAGMVTG